MPQYTQISYTACSYKASIARTIKGLHLVAHDPGQVLEQLFERPELLGADGDDGALEKLVRVDEEPNFLGALLGRDVNERRSVRRRLRRRRHRDRRLWTGRAVLAAAVVVDAFDVGVDAHFPELDDRLPLDDVVDEARLLGRGIVQA